MNKSKQFEFVHRKVKKQFLCHWVNVTFLVRTQHKKKLLPDLHNLKCKKLHSLYKNNSCFFFSSCVFFFWNWFAANFLFKQVFFFSRCSWCSMTLPMCLSFQMARKFVFPFHFHPCLCFFSKQHTIICVIVHRLPRSVLFIAVRGRILFIFDNVNDVNLKLEDIVFFTFPHFNVISISFRARMFIYISEIFRVSWILVSVICFALAR